MQSTTELIVRRDGDVTELRAPEVGLFTCALAPGCLLGPGQAAGVILSAGRPTQLVVPPGVHGRVTGTQRERIQAPVGYGEVLYTLAPIDGALDDAPDAIEQDTANGLFVVASQAGRFYQRPSPDEDNYVCVGDTLGEGQAIGLIEIMKTFSQVHYEAVGGLPPRAMLVRFIVEDGAEVRPGDRLIEVEPL